MIAQRKTIKNDEEYLRQVSRAVTRGEDYKDEIELMREFCRGTEFFALTAVQIGIPKRIVYLKNTTLAVPLDETEYDEAKILINPVVLECKGKTKFWEACVSCLDNTGLVVRPYEMRMRYLDENWVEHEEVFRGFAATVLAHELDHLEGVLHMDVAEKVLWLNKAERKALRDREPYTVISRDCVYTRPITQWGSGRW